jgi:hypothetical protein
MTIYKDLFEPITLDPNLLVPNNAELRSHANASRWCSL